MLIFFGKRSLRTESQKNVRGEFHVRCQQHETTCLCSKRPILGVCLRVCRMRPCIRPCATSSSRNRQKKSGRGHVLLVNVDRRPQCDAKSMCFVCVCKHAQRTMCHKKSHKTFRQNQTVRQKDLMTESVQTSNSAIADAGVGSKRQDLPSGSS